MVSKYVGRGKRNTLTEVRKFLLEVIGETECNDGKTGVVVCGGFVFFWEDLCGGAEEGVFSHGAVDVRDACIPIRAED
jgi:hypothetical protein